MKVGGVILCGGESRRMGRSKAWLEIGEEPMLERLVRLVSQVVGPVVVVAAQQQDLPDLPDSIVVTHDRQPGRGPLEGLYCGFSQLPADVEAAFVTACDLPLLQPSFIRRLIELLDEHDVVVPAEDEHLHPLAAVYRTRLVDRIAVLLDQGERKIRRLFQPSTTRLVPVDELRSVDPQLLSLVNVNRPHDYQRARRLVAEQVRSRFRAGGNR